MNVQVKGKNCNISDNMVTIVEKKFAKLDKYFPEEITAEVLIKKEGEHFKTEASIHAKKHIFRAVINTQDPYDAVDRLVDKLSSQMSRFKTKLQKKYKDNKDFSFSELSEPEDDNKTAVKAVKKNLELTVMSADEAIAQMEQLEYEFYVFLNDETDRVTVAYKRPNGDYGLLETVY